MISFKLSNCVNQLESSATIAMSILSKQLLAQGKPVISLGLGEPNFKTPDCIIKAAKNSLDRGEHYYTPIRGSDELVRSVITKMKRDQNLSYEPAQIVSTIGAKAALSLVIDAMINPGDEVLILSPYWVTYPELVKLAGGVPVFLPCLKDTYQPDLAAIKKAIGSKTKMIILNTPNNPTGAVYSRDSLYELMELLKNTNICVISDEIYEHLVFDDCKHISPASLSHDAYERTVVITGASKGYAMTGWRVGIASGPKPIIDAMVKLQSQRYTCVASMCQAAAAYAFLEDEELSMHIEIMRHAYEERRNAMWKMLMEIPGVTCSMPMGAFYLFPNFSAIEPDDMKLAHALLEEAYVTTVPGSSFGHAGCLRLSTSASLENIEEALQRVQKWCKAKKG